MVSVTMVNDFPIGLYCGWHISISQPQHKHNYGKAAVTSKIFRQISNLVW